MRTDRHRNPTAFITAIAKQAGLVLNRDYLVGAPFAGGTLYTAKLLGDPLELTIRVIDKVGFYTKTGAQRWNYIGIPFFIWSSLTRAEKVAVIGWMYHREGGTAMKHLFPAA